jgi:hypothetical protein
VFTNKRIRFARANLIKFHGRELSFK